jgi:hypothetical protein
MLAINEQSKNLSCSSLRLNRRPEELGMGEIGVHEERRVVMIGDS